MPVLSDGGSEIGKVEKQGIDHFLAKTCPIDLKLGHKLDINETNDSKRKNPTSDMLTSRDVIFPSFSRF